MKHFQACIVFSFLFFFLSPNSSAQESQAGEVEIDRLVTSLYQVLSFRNTWTGADSVKDFFSDDAKLMAMFGNAPQVWTVENYILGMKANIEKQQVSTVVEREIKFEQHIFGNIAQRFSTYEITLVINGKEVRRAGINAFQLVRENGRWKIASLAWDRESDTLKVPARYRP